MERRPRGPWRGGCRPWMLGRRPQGLGSRTWPRCGVASRWRKGCAGLSASDPVACLGEESVQGQVQGPRGAVGRWTGLQGRGRRHNVRARLRRRTRAQHATSLSRSTSCPPVVPSCTLLLGQGSPRSAPPWEVAELGWRR